MPDSYIQVSPDSTGKKIRTRQRTVGANTVEEQYMIPISERVATFKGAFCSFRTLGTGTASPHNLFSVENAAGSSVLVAVKKLSVYSNHTAALAVLQPLIALYRITTAPTGGTTATKTGLDSSQSSNASVTIRQASSADATASAITATAAGARLWSGFTMRWHTLAGADAGHIATDITQALNDDQIGDSPLVLRAGEFLLMQAIYVNTTDNPTSRHYLINVVWEEYTVP